MKFYVTDIGDSSVGIQELTVAELELDQNMIEVLESEDNMTAFKIEFMNLIQRYFEPEVSYEVYSDKDIEEEAKWEEEYEKELLKDIEMDKQITEQYHSEKPSVVDVLSGKVPTEHVSVRIVNVVGAETRR